MIKQENWSLVLWEYALLAMKKKNGITEENAGIAEKHT